MKIKCMACNREYTEEEAGKLKICIARTTPKVTILKVFCICSHILDISEWKKG
jgi:hypothetical protein